MDVQGGCKMQEANYQYTYGQIYKVLYHGPTGSHPASYSFNGHIWSLISLFARGSN